MFFGQAPLFSVSTQLESQVSSPQAGCLSIIFNEQNYGTQQIPNKGTALMIKKMMGSVNGVIWRKNKKGRGTAHGFGQALPFDECTTGRKCMAR